MCVVRGGKALLRKRWNLAAAGLTQARWRRQWESARLFLTADGEKDKVRGNETIRWNPDEGWLEVIGAADVELSADELTEIEAAASKIQVQGGRYNEAAERMTNL